MKDTLQYNKWQRAVKLPKEYKDFKLIPPDKSFRGLSRSAKAKKNYDYRILNEILSEALKKKN